MLAIPFGRRAYKALIKVMTQKAKVATVLRVNLSYKY
jgi:hypothetical protein